MWKIVITVILGVISWLLGRDSPKATLSKLEKEIADVRSKLQDELEKDCPNDVIVCTLSDKLHGLVKERDSLRTPNG